MQIFLVSLLTRPQRRRSPVEFGIKSMRVRYSYVPLPVHKKAADLFTRFTERTKKFGPLPDEKRKVIKQKVLG